MQAAPFWITTLAIDPDLIVSALGVIMIVGAAVANALRGSKDDENDTGPKDEDSVADRRRKLEELAAQRRARLEQMRRGAAGPNTAGGSASTREAATPGNMTVAERIERERARAAYAQRAEALRRQQAQASGARPAASGQAPRQAPASPSTARGSQTAGAGGRPATARPAPSPASRSARPAQPRDRMPTLETLPANAKEAAKSGQRRKPSTERSQSPIYNDPNRAKRGSRGLEALRRINLKDAFIMKEILDKPVALRESPDNHLS